MGLERIWCLWVLPIMFQSFALPVGAAAQITFDDAIAFGTNAPSARAPAAALRARRRGDEGMGGTLQGTQITLMPGGVIHPKSERDVDLQLNVTQGWNLGGLGDARRISARRERRGLAAERRAAALRSRLSAGRHWLALRTLEQISELLADAEKDAVRLTEATSRAVTLGVSTAADLANARAYLADLSQRRLSIEGDRYAAAQSLGLAMGKVRRKRLQTIGPLPEPVLPSLAELRQRIREIDALPEVVASRLAEVATRAREDEEHARYAPVLQLGMQVERGAGGVWVGYGIAGLQWNAFGQRARATSLAAAETARARVVGEELRQRARAELLTALHTLEHAERERRNLGERLLPARTEHRAKRERALLAGEGTRFALFEARQREQEAREMLMRASGATAFARVQMWLFLAEIESAEGGAR